MGLPPLKQVENNLNNYIHTNHKLVEKFREAPFFHQLGSGNYQIDEEIYVKQFESILENGYILCNKVLKEKNIQSISNTYPSDVNSQRDEYIYLMLGSVVRPLSKTYISIEIPNKIVSSTIYSDSFFCNDQLLYTISETEEKWEDSVLTIQDGIGVIAGIVGKLLKNPEDYMKQYSLNLSDVMYLIRENEFWFNPEFAIKEKLGIRNSQITFHIVGYGTNQVDNIESAIKKNNYSKKQLIVHNSSNDFVDYLTKKILC